MKPLFLFQREMTPLRKLLLMKAVAGGKLIEYTATGNPLTFNTNVSKPLKSLLIPWTPTQTGSGDPSPENVRPITGVRGLTISHSGGDTSNPDTINVTFPGEVGTVYGGSLDLVSGVLTVNYMMRMVKDFDWRYDNYNGANIFKTAGIENLSYRLGNIDIVSDMLKSQPTINSYADASDWTNYSTGLYRSDATMRMVFIKYTASENPSDMVSALGDAELLMNYITPQTVQLSPQQITALTGDNTIWSDTNGSNTAVYLKRG